MNGGFLLCGLGVISLAFTYLSIKSGKVFMGGVFHTKKDDPGYYRLYTIISLIAGVLLLLIGLHEIISQKGHSAIFDRKS